MKVSDEYHREEHLERKQKSWMSLGDASSEATFFIHAAAIFSSSKESISIDSRHLAREPVLATSSNQVSLFEATLK